MRKIKSPHLTPRRVKHGEYVNYFCAVWLFDAGCDLTMMLTFFSNSRVNTDMTPVGGKKRKKITMDEKLTKDEANWSLADNTEMVQVCLTQKYSNPKKGE